MSLTKRYLTYLLISTCFAFSGHAVWAAQPHVHDDVFQVVQSEHYQGNWWHPENITIEGETYNREEVKAIIKQIKATSVFDSEKEIVLKKGGWWSSDTTAKLSVILRALSTINHIKAQLARERERASESQDYNLEAVLAKTLETFPEKELGIAGGPPSAHLAAAGASLSGCPSLQSNPELGDDEGVAGAALPSSVVAPASVPDSLGSEVGAGATVLPSRPGQAEPHENNDEIDDIEPGSSVQRPREPLPAPAGLDTTEPDDEARPSESVTGHQLILYRPHPLFPTPAPASAAGDDDGAAGAASGVPREIKRVTSGDSVALPPWLVAPPAVQQFLRRPDSSARAPACPEIFPLLPPLQVVLPSEQQSEIFQVPSGQQEGPVAPPVPVPPAPVNSPKPTPPVVPPTPTNDPPVKSPEGPSNIGPSAIVGMGCGAVVVVFAQKSFKKRSKKAQKKKVKQQKKGKRQRSRSKRAS